MVARRILFLDANRLTAYHWQGGLVGEEEEFAADTGGLVSFGDYLARHRGSLFYLLADVAEEGFQPEDIPHATGRDRIALIKRKLGQYYYGTPLVAAMTQGRQKEGRRDERMLFAALTRPQHFDPWLGALRQAEVALAGVFSLPQTLANLAPGYGRVHKILLLITLTHGGLRQTFFADGQLRFSRLTALATGTLDESSIACSIEATKIYQYLTSQRLITRGTPLPVLVLLHPAQTPVFQERCRDTEELRFEYLDLQAEATRAGLKNALHGSHGESLFVHLLIQRTPRIQFVHGEARRFHLLGQLRLALTATSIVVLAACLLFAGKQLLMLHQLRTTAELVAPQTEAATQRYRALLRNLPEIPLSTDNLRTLVDQYDDLARRSPSPEPMTRFLASILTDYPRIELERLNWTLASRIEDVLAPATTEKTATPEPIAGEGPFAVLDIDATLPLSMVNDHRGQLELINGFVQRLRGRPATQVRILSLPFDAEAGKVLKSSGGTTATDAPRVSLRMVQSRVAAP